MSGGNLGVEQPAKVGYIECFLPFFCSTTCIFLTAWPPPFLSIKTIAQVEIYIDRHANPPTFSQAYCVTGLSMLRGNKQQFLSTCAWHRAQGFLRAIQSQKSANGIIQATNPIQNPEVGRTTIKQQIINTVEIQEEIRAPIETRKARQVSKTNHGPLSFPALGELRPINSSQQVKLKRFLAPCRDWYQGHRY